jgi:Kef-type K+ transport system membrane component KefB
MLLAAVYIFPRIINLTELWKSEGIVESLATAFAFGLASLSAFVGLSPVVGAFAAGMAMASSNAILQIKSYIEKLKLIFGPLFFAVIGTYFDLSQVLNVNVLLVLIVVLVAVISKVAGCGLPAAYFLRNRRSGLSVGIGMISRGEVGFIIAGLGLTGGILASQTYNALLIVILVTTIISPIMLRRSLVSEEK